MSSKVLVVLSGGLDSTTLAYDFQSKGWQVSAISFDYGQKHGGQELAAAQYFAAQEGWWHRTIRMAEIGQQLKSALLLGGEDVPEGHYAADNMKATVVPNRNAIMMSIATGIAVSREIPYIATAVHAGDHPIYPDCRGDFIATLSEAFRLGNDGFMGIMAPFVQLSKNDIAQRAVDLDFDWYKTWSCYKGGVKHCGKCGTCVERMEALWSTSYGTDLDVGDITEQRLEYLFPDNQYEDNRYWMTALEGAK